MIVILETGENPDEAFAIDDFGICNSGRLWL